MIRCFKKEDIHKLELNEYHGIDAIGATLDQYAAYLLKFHSWTLEYEGKVQCILSTNELVPGTYMSGILLSKDFNPICAKEVKKFIHEYVIPHFNMTRLETDSVDCEVLNRWHEFLGFTSEGVKRKYLNGKDYRIWSIV